MGLSRGAATTTTLSLHLQWHRGNAFAVRCRGSLTEQHHNLECFIFSLYLQTWNSPKLRWPLASQVKKNSEECARSQHLNSSVCCVLMTYFMFIVLKEIKPECCWSPPSASDATFLCSFRNDFYKVTQSGWLQWLNQQMENRNGLIGPLTSIPSSHLFLRAFLLLHLIASEITQSHFVPFASDCDHFCSPADANKKRSRQPRWRSSRSSCSSGVLKCERLLPARVLLCSVSNIKALNPPI